MKNVPITPQEIKTENFFDIRPIYGDMTGQKDLRVPGKTAEQCLNEWFNAHPGFYIITTTSRQTMVGNMITVYYREP